MEKFPKPEIAPERKATPKRLMMAIETMLKTQVKDILINGMEHLSEVPKDKKIIVAVSHITDIDVLLAIKALGNDFDLAVANPSFHHKFSEEWPTNIGLRIAGKDNFFPIDFKKNGEEKKPSAFNPENFEPMQKAMEGGKSMAIAAHSPSHAGRLEKGGYAAVYLSALTDAIIIPVGINLKSEKPVGMYENPLETLKKRPDAEINIGIPFNLEKIEGIEDLAAISSKRKRGEKLTEVDVDRFSDLAKQLRKQSDLLMKKISELVPEEKRGIYKDERQPRKALSEVQS